MVTTRGWRILAATGAAAVVAFLVLPASWATPWYHVATAGLLAVLAVALVRARSSVDPGWWLLAAALVALTLRGLVSELPATPAVQGVHVGLVAAGYLCALGASGRFIAVRTNLRDVDGIIDGLILGCAMAVVLWELVATSVVTGLGAHPAMALFLVAQSLVVSLAVRMMFWGTWRLASGWLVFAAAATCFAANLGFVLAASGNHGIPHSWVGASWLTAVVLVVLAATHRSRSALTEVTLPGLSRVPYARLAILGFAVIAARVSLVQHVPVDIDGLVPAVGSVVLTALVVARLFRLVVERERARGELAQRAEQHAALVRLGHRALAGSELARLFDEAAVAVAQSLRVDHTGIFEPVGAETLTLRAAVGWEVTDSHRPIVSVAEPFFGVPMAACAPGYLENDMGGGGRHSELLRHSRVVAGVSVPIGTPSARYGVLAVATTRPRRFSADDLTFLRAVSNVLTGAIERDRIEDEIRHAALHDSLTGLPNRVLLLDRMENALSRAHRMGTQVAVMAVDLDGFQTVNDTFGRKAGDQLLVAVARRLQKALRSEDTLARLAADEFVVVCERIEDLATIAMIAQRIVDTLRQPFVLDVGTTQISGSVGIAVGAGRGEDMHQLIRDADTAMYRAKTNGAARYELARGDWVDAQKSA